MNASPLITSKDSWPYLYFDRIPQYYKSDRYWYHVKMFQERSKKITINLESDSLIPAGDQTG
jgi:hypothetical protein